MKKTSLKIMVPVSMPAIDTVVSNPRWMDEIRFIFCHLFYQRTLMRKNKNYAPGIERSTGWVPVDSIMMKGIMSNRYNKFMRLLMGLGIIEMKLNKAGRPDFVPKLFTLKYRVLFGVVKPGDRKYRVEYITHPKVMVKIISHFEKKYEVQKRKFLKENDWYKPNLELLERMYVSDEAIAFAQKQEGREDNLIGSIGLFNSKIGRFVNRDDFAGRIHHFGGVLEKDLRPFIRVTGSDEPMIIADIKSCQPYLMSAIFYFSHILNELLPEFLPIEEKINSLRFKPDVRIFFEKCQSAQFYPDWIDQVKLPKEKAKRKLFRHVFYSSASNQHKKREIKEERMRYREFFKANFRNVYEIISKLKRTQRATLPFVYEATGKNGKKGKMYVTPNMMAQRAEVRIVLERITKKLNEAGVISVTIHDAWILPAKHRAEFERIFAETFAELKIRPPQLEINDLNSCDNNIEP